MDLASLNNNPLEIVVGDRPRKFYVGSARKIGKLQEWLNTLPFPKRGQQIAPDMPSVIASAIAAQQAEAAKDWPPSASSGEGMSIINRDDRGKALLLKLSLQHGEPTISDADADAMLDFITQEEYSKIALKFYGFMENEGPKGIGAGGNAPTNGSQAPNPESTTSMSSATS